MPWNNGGPGNTGGGGSNNGPWGNPQDKPSQRPGPQGPQGPQGPRGPWGGGGGGPRGPGGQPPDLDEVIARVQGFLRGFSPFGGGGGGRRGTGTGFPSGRGAAIIGVLAVGAWLASGFYRVQPDEQGVVLRFGAFNRTTFPGLNYHVPWPVEAVLRPAVTRINRVEIGYRSGNTDARPTRGVTGATRLVPEESLMLTGDENIIDIDCAVFWRVRDAGAFLFSTRNPGYTVKSAAESVMREVIGRTPIQPALTDARAQIEASVLRGVQAIVDQYGSGVEITQVQLQKVDPPNGVIESFRDVQRANTDGDRMRNEAQSYHNDIVPRARGDAARLVAEADGARQVSIAQSQGEAKRFLSVLQAYQASRDVTMQRLYLETMQDILTHTPTVIVDDQLKGVVPFLPLNDVGRTPPPRATPGPNPGAAPLVPSIPQVGASR